MRIHFVLAIVLASLASVSGQNAKVTAATDKPKPAAAAKAPATQQKVTPTVKSSTTSTTTTTAPALKRQNAVTSSRSPSASTEKLKLPNWVGPKKGEATMKACYRKTHLAHAKKCPPGYRFDNVKTCWAECPIEYPVSCKFECLPQNQNCAKDIFDKVSTVVDVALNAASSGVFGKLSTAAKGVQLGVECGQALFTVVTDLVGIMDDIQTTGDLASKRKALVYALKNSNVAINDVPSAVTTCLGLDEIKNLDKAATITTEVGNLLEKVVDHYTNGESLLKLPSFLKFAKDTGNVGASVTKLDATGEAKLKELVGNGPTCGARVQGVIDKTVRSIEELKEKTPSATVSEVRYAVMNSQLILKDLPNAILNCFSTKDATTYETRDQILKTAHTIIDKVIDASSENDKPVTKEHYKTSLVKLALGAIAFFDQTGIAAMANEFVQPICGPTAYVGDITDGSAEDALGLSAMQKAFRGTTGTWTKEGDGKVTLRFESVDKKKVTVNILSAGKLAYQVEVEAGAKVTWSKPLSEFQGKTMYLDRWRAGALGMPGSGGGSVLLWVPLSTKGSISLTVPINPTTFLNHKRE